MDELKYIRDAIMKYGRKARVSVTRWEMNMQTGMRDKPFSFEVPAHIALEQFSKPMHKRSRVWQMIRPNGQVIEEYGAGKISFNSLSDPALKQSLIEEAKAQLLAEMNAANPEDKPKRKKKSVELAQPEAEADTNTEIDNTEIEEA
jgi:hypothetical protein